MPKASRRAKVIIVAVVTAVIASPFVFAVLWDIPREIAERRNRLPFDSSTWKASLANNSNDSIRLRMVDDLLRRHSLLGMTREDVMSLLGHPPKTEYFRDYDFVYWLGPERSFMSIDSEWLAVKFSEDGRVSKARLVSD
jgi:hypothetical protein